MGVMQTSGEETRKLRIPLNEMEQYSLIQYFWLAITKIPYDLTHYQSYRGITESEKYVPNVLDNARNIWRA